ncbi:MULTISPECIES: N-formylglutamate amidohydrolase [unclassified Yoonia]|uniref:N-formylglutamate amidohydrolase n=1 Tax=unclassified Yoonia TaxID=2629118 RepID=UPI002AFF3C2C|nr:MULTISPECIES: N-formylglutamate amidohydrolase [unclassified Yoonia]
MTDEAYQVEGAHRPGRWLVTCDHATNHVPDWVAGGDLGLPAADMARHIAYDIGAAGVTRHLAALLDSPAILSGFSRLVIDPNRGEDDPTLLMRLYDGTIIPGNRYAGVAELEERLARLYRPYHDAYAGLAAGMDAPVICAVHSFTPQLRGRPPRPWQVGVLYGRDERLALPLIDACRAEGWCVGANEPYTGHLPGDAIDRHALQQGRANVLIELRHDLIADEAGQRDWAEKLAPILARVLAETGL